MVVWYEGRHLCWMEVPYENGLIIMVFTGAAKVKSGVQLKISWKAMGCWERMVCHIVKWDLSITFKYSGFRVLQRSDCLASCKTLTLLPPSTVKKKKKGFTLNQDFGRIKVITFLNRNTFPITSFSLEKLVKEQWVENSDNSTPHTNISLYNNQN